MEAIQPYQVMELHRPLVSLYRVRYQASGSPLARPLPLVSSCSVFSESSDFDNGSLLLTS